MVLLGEEEIIMGREEDQSCSMGGGGEENCSNLLVQEEIPKDHYNLTYTIYFCLGAGFLLPWNAFITAVDYFSYLYPGVGVDRIFSIVYMFMALFSLLVIVASANRADAFVRINLGLLLFLFALLLVPFLDLVFIKGRSRVFYGFYVTVAAVGLSGVADGLVQGGVIGSAGRLPKRFMHAVVAGTAASGVLISLLRIMTKSVYPQTPKGLRQSANLYFAVSVAFMWMCIVFYNVAHRLPVVKYYKNLKVGEEEEEGKEERGRVSIEETWVSTLWGIVGTVKWHGFGILLIYVVTLSIFPGYVTEDVHSAKLRDWYSILLITSYNFFDLVGKTLTAFYMLENTKVAVGASVTRLLFYPLFLGCLHGPRFLRTEVPVTILTCLLGLTNGYVTSVLMILSPKAVPPDKAEYAGIVMVLFLVVGLAVGSLVSWFWVI